jgi:hypothetical protein
VLIEIRFSEQAFDLAAQVGDLIQNEALYCVRPVHHPPKLVTMAGRRISCFRITLGLFHATAGTTSASKLPITSQTLRPHTPIPMNDGKAADRV